METSLDEQQRVSSRICQKKTCRERVFSVLASCELRVAKLEKETVCPYRLAIHTVMSAYTFRLKRLDDSTVTDGENSKIQLLSI